MQKLLGIGVLDARSVGLRGVRSEFLVEQDQEHGRFAAPHAERDALLDPLLDSCSFNGRHIRHTVLLLKGFQLGPALRLSIVEQFDR